jgi:hypothetical protein
MPIIASEYTLVHVLSIVPTNAKVKPFTPLEIEIAPYIMFFFPKAFKVSGTYHKGRPILAFICKIIFEAADMFLFGCSFERVLLLIT